MLWYFRDMENREEERHLINRGQSSDAARRASRRAAVVLAGVGAVCIITAAVLSVYVGKGSRDASDQRSQKVKASMTDDTTLNLHSASLDSISRHVMDEIRPENIKAHLRRLTANPKLAGTPADLEQARYVKDFWQNEVGLSPVNIMPYDVLLSFPEPDRPNRIEMQDGTGNAIHVSAVSEEVLRDEEQSSNTVPPFNAFSAAGSPKGDLVYVNYGRLEDFIFVTEDKGMNLSSRICIVRYGSIFRGEKVKFAEQYGCKGLVIFSDPADYVRGSTVYPDSRWLPDTGVQRGQVRKNDIGHSDPLTPGYPAIESAFRLPLEEADLPGIPVQPIGYGDAKVFLQNLAGDRAPDKWQGGLPITYNLGPGFTNSTWKIQMFISTNGERRKTYDAIGFIEGALEPDRYVLMGNHRDAWVFGALDPTIGTATMLEVSRAMGQLVKQGWRPRRSIVFCSWGAEEPGLIGSGEWIEHYERLLGARAVAYINGDTTVDGRATLTVSAMPLLHDIIYEAAKKVTNPSQSEREAGRHTVYDTWLNKLPHKDSTGTYTGRPRINMLGASSDHAFFVNRVGVSSAMFGYREDPDLNLPSSSLYHTAYDTFYQYETFIDPNASIAVATGQFWSDVVIQLADRPLIPFSTIHYPTALAEYLKVIHDTYESSLKLHGLTRALNYFDGAVEKFYAAEHKFRARVKKTHAMSDLQLRQVNDQMMALERNFIDPIGLPGRPLIRHVLYAPSTKDSYLGSAFPGLIDSLAGIEEIKDPEEERARWRSVAKQLSVITYFIESAADILAPPTYFMSDKDFL